MQRCSFSMGSKTFLCTVPLLPSSAAIAAKRVSISCFTRFSISVKALIAAAEITVAGGAELFFGPEAST